MSKTILKLKSTKGTGAKRPANVESVLKKDKVYGLTIRHNPTYKGLTNNLYTDDEKRDLYNQVIGRFQQRGLQIDHVYYEHKGGLHLHCRARYHKSLYFKKWQVFPFSCKFVEQWDNKGWLSYCKKSIFDTALHQFKDYAFSDDEELSTTKECHHKSST